MTTAVERMLGAAVADVAERPVLPYLRMSVDRDGARSVLRAA